MKPEPLKGKELPWNENVTFFSKGNIKAAVEWFKQRMDNIESGDDFINYKDEVFKDIYFSKAQIIDWINEAFEDVVK